MARFVVDIDVEYAEIKIGCVWFSIADVKQLIKRLEAIMEARGWDKEEDKAC